MKSWNDFDEFKEIINKYMPDMGEGETMASQTATAINRLIYKWFNDGDVYDNTQHMRGWMNDLSDCANWLYLNCGVEYARAILRRISDCYTDDAYEKILYDLAKALLYETRMTLLAGIERQGSIYDCKGPFHFIDHDDESEDEW